MTDLANALARAGLKLPNDETAPQSPLRQALIQGILAQRKLSERVPIDSLIMVIVDPSEMLAAQAELAEFEKKLGEKLLAALRAEKAVEAEARRKGWSPAKSRIQNKTAVPITDLIAQAVKLCKAAGLNEVRVMGIKQKSPEAARIIQLMQSRPQDLGYKSMMIVFDE